jgi:hypothetical protein
VKQSLSAQSISTLRRSLNGRVILPDDAEYDQARAARRSLLSPESRWTDDFR